MRSKKDPQGAIDNCDELLGLRRRGSVETGGEGYASSEDGSDDEQLPKVNTKLTRKEKRERRL